MLLTRLVADWNHETASETVRPADRHSHRQTDRLAGSADAPCWEIGFIKDVLVGCLVVIYKVAVGHVGQLLTITMLAALWGHHPICDQIGQEGCPCNNGIQSPNM